MVVAIIRRRSSITTTTTSSSSSSNNNNGSNTKLHQDQNISLASASTCAINMAGKQPAFTNRHGSITGSGGISIGRASYHNPPSSCTNHIKKVSSMRRSRSAGNATTTSSSSNSKRSSLLVDYSKKRATIDLESEGLASSSTSTRRTSATTSSTSACSLSPRKRSFQHQSLARSCSEHNTSNTATRKQPLTYYIDDALAKLNLNLNDSKGDWEPWDVNVDVNVNANKLLNEESQQSHTTTTHSSSTHSSTLPEANTNNGPRSQPTKEPIQFRVRRSNMVNLIERSSASTDEHTKLSSFEHLQKSVRNLMEQQDKELHDNSSASFHADDEAPSPPTTMITPRPIRRTVSTPAIQSKRGSTTPPPTGDRRLLLARMKMSNHSSKTQQQSMRNLGSASSSNHGTTNPNLESMRMMTLMKKSKSSRSLLSTTTDTLTSSTTPSKPQRPSLAATRSTGGSARQLLGATRSKSSRDLLGNNNKNKSQQDPLSTGSDHSYLGNNSTALSRRNPMVGSDATSNNSNNRRSLLHKQTSGSRRNLIMSDATDTSHFVTGSRIRRLDLGGSSSSNFKF